MRAVRATLANALLKGEATSARTVEPLIDLFESVADLYSRKWLDRPIIDGAFSVHILHWWVALKSYVEAAQGQYRDASIYECFQRLALQYIQEDRTAKGMPPVSLEELNTFLRSECE